MPHAKIDVTDLYSKKGARLLAEAISTYWRGLGYIVFVESFPIPETGLWGVKSNLLNGRPRGMR